MKQKETLSHKDDAEQNKSNRSSDLLRHSGGDSSTDTMARRVQQRLSAAWALILIRTEDVGRKVSHGGNNSKKQKGL